MPPTTIPEYSFDDHPPPPKPTLAITLILPNLYISPPPNPRPRHPLPHTHILTMSFYPLSPRIYRQCKYLHLPMKDEDDITPHIPSITTFVSSALRPANPTTNNNVLIHCVSGN